MYLINVYVGGTFIIIVMWNQAKVTEFDDSLKLVLFYILLLKARV